MSSGFPAPILPVDEEQHRANKAVLSSLRQLVDALEDRNNKGLQSFQDYAKQVEESPLPPEQKRSIYAQLRARSLQLDPQQTLEMVTNAAASMSQPGTSGIGNTSTTVSTPVPHHPPPMTAGGSTSLHSQNNGSGLPPHRSTPINATLVQTQAIDHRHTAAAGKTPSLPLQPSNKASAPSVAQPPAQQFDAIAHSWAKSQPPGSVLPLPQMDKRKMRLFKLQDCQIVIQHWDEAGVWRNLNPARAPPSLKMLNDVSVQSWRAQQKALTAHPSASPVLPQSAPTRALSGSTSALQRVNPPPAPSASPIPRAAPAPPPFIPPQRNTFSHNTSQPPTQSHLPSLVPQAQLPPSQMPSGSYRPELKSTAAGPTSVPHKPLPTGLNPYSQYGGGSQSGLLVHSTQSVPSGQLSLGANSAPARSPADADIRYLARDILRACGKSAHQIKAPPPPPPPPQQQQQTSLLSVQKLNPDTPLQTEVQASVTQNQTPLPAPPPLTSTPSLPQVDESKAQSSAPLTLNSEPATVSPPPKLPKSPIPVVSPLEAEDLASVPAPLPRPNVPPVQGHAVPSTQVPPAARVAPLPKPTEIIDVDSWGEDELLLSVGTKANEVQVRSDSPSPMRDSGRSQTPAHKRSSHSRAGSRIGRHSPRVSSTPGQRSHTSPAASPSRGVGDNRRVTDMRGDILTFADREEEATSPRRNYAFVRVPSPPEWVLQDSRLKRRAKGKEVVRDPQKVFEDSLEDIERAIFDASWRVRRERPCDWEECGAILNSAENLSKHVRQHTVARTSKTICQWKGCQRVIEGPKFEFLGHLLEHVRGQLYCALDGCDESFPKLKYLITHINQTHRLNQRKKPPPVPSEYTPEKPPQLDAQAPSHLLMLPYLQKTPISSADQSHLGPWVLRQIAGHIEYALEATIEGVKHKDLMTSDVLTTHREYDFLTCPEKVYDNNPRRRRIRGRFADISSSKATAAIAQGLILFPGQGDRRAGNLESMVENMNIQSDRE